MAMYVGEVVIIRSTVKIDGVLADPSSINISVIKGTVDGSVVLAPVGMIQTAVGEYEYYWNTTGMTAGTYHAKIHATKTEPGNWEFLRITLNK